MELKQLSRYVGILILVLSLTAGVMLEGCHSGSPKNTADGKVYYTCPMHPQIHEDKPGNCPICGMKLVKIETDTSSAISLAASLSYLTEPVTQTVVGDFKVISPERINPSDTITAEGYMGFDERALNTVSSRVSGRIEKLYVKYTNQRIRPGEPLMKIYSPQLLSAQRDLLQAVRDKDTAIITSLKQNLYNLGMNRQDVEQVIQTGQPLVDITIYSPYEGISQKTTAGPNTVMPAGNSAMNAATSSNTSGAPELLNIREGMYVDAGQTVFSVQNINWVWAILNVFNGDIPSIRPGDPVRLSAAANPANIISGKVDFIPPYRVDNEKSTRVIVYLSKLNCDWKIGTLLRGRIATGGDEQGWSVPLSAVNRLGTSSVVWVVDKKYPHVFHARKVVTGDQIRDHILIISGLREGDKIAENASYMVDSDSFIQ